MLRCQQDSGHEAAAYNVWAKVLDARPVRGSTVFAAAQGRLRLHDAPIVITSGDISFAFAPAKVPMARSTIGTRLVLVGLPLLLRAQRCGALAHGLTNNQARASTEHRKDPAPAYRADAGFFLRLAYLATGHFGEGR